MLEKQFENVFVDSNKTISFFNFCDEFNINFSKSHIENHYVKNHQSNFIFSIEFESFICFENFSEFLSNSKRINYFFFFNDSINIRVKKSINFSTEFSVLTISYQYMIHFWFLKIFKIYIRLFSKSIWFFSHR